MSEVERYLKQATLGLWGQKKRDARTELRGAIEDKVYRHQLSGLSETDAEHAALRDLGSPTIIARDLNRVHTGPQMLRATLLLGLASLLGFQALAQITPIASAVPPRTLRELCNLPSAADLQATSAADRAVFQRAVAEQGGPAAYLRQCQQDVTRLGSNALLRVTDVLAALTIGGIDVGDQTDFTSATSTTPLIVYTGKTPGPLYNTTDISGERYIGAGDLIAFLTFATTAPLHLSGARNPVLQVGKAGLQLGNDRAPTFATNVVAALILRDMGGLNLPRPAELAFAPDGGRLLKSAPRLSVPGQDGEHFAVIQNFERVKGHSAEWLMVRARTNGTVPIAFKPVTPAPRLVTTLAELDTATARKENAVLVYRVNAADLRHVTLAQVPAQQLRLMPKGT
ncbi:permease prefix domain 1-containing protein [Deinococcus altitudinis]|uniref:permease prefix domain 1-containing protein n=1 Tax=Deinococcus altitudinis TaxID=468914 RepID=UPI00389199F9